MDINLFKLVVFALLLVSVGLFVIRKQMTSKVSLYVFGIYVVSSICAIIYYKNPLFSLARPVSMILLLYWLMIFLIICIPIIRFDKKKYSEIKYNYKLTELIGLFCFLVSIVPFVELCVKLPSIFSSDLVSTFSDIHDEENKEVPLSWIGKILMKFVYVMYDLSFVLIYPLLNSKKRNKIAIAGVVLVILTEVLVNVTLSRRNMILRAMLQFVLIAIIYYPLLSQKIRKWLRNTLIIVGTIILTFFVVITIARQIGYSERIGDDYSMVYFLSRYGGEGLVNFSQYMGEIKHNTNGAYCFTYFEKNLGMDVVTEASREYISTTIHSKIGIPVLVFYTFIGFFVIDIGFVGTLLFFIVLSSLINYLIKSKRTISLSHIYAFFIYVTIVVSGTCVYQYTWANSIYIPIYILIFLILKFFKS